MLLRSFLSRLLVSLFLGSGSAVATSQTISGIDYLYPADHLAVGQSYGNQDCYVTLDGGTNVIDSQGTVRIGLRESSNQQYYLFAWELRVHTAHGSELTPTITRFSPAFQETELRQGAESIEKLFFLPFEDGYQRSAHFLLRSANDTGTPLQIQSRILLPPGVKVEQATYEGHRYLRVRYADGAESILWGSASLQSMEVGQPSSHGGSIPITADFNWTPGSTGREFAISFAYSITDGGKADEMLLNALFDRYSKDMPLSENYLKRIHKLLRDSSASIQRYLEEARFWSPDATIDRGFAWAKVNQLRMQEAYRWGSGFSNNPPSDIVVSRDSVWYLMGSSYYAQAWSRKLLDFWFQYGMELDGKPVEYVTASRDPIFRDDYGLNISDNTPLMLLAAHHYYSLTADQGFLHAVYPSLLRSANYILAQRAAGDNNRYGLVWCDSTETFVRGLCGWRNAIKGYNLAGALTEVNAECFQALLAVADLAKDIGDEPNQVRLEAAAQDLRQTIEEHLRASEPSNHFYYLNINPMGKPVSDLTSDLLFPPLFGVSDKATSRAVLAELFSSHFWAGNPESAGGIRTVSSSQPGYQARSTPENYGLLGGVWPNVALWAAKAAAVEGLPDLALQGIRGTFLLSERPNPIHFNVVAGEFPEYFNGDDLVQNGMPLSPFVPGIYIWSSLEGLLGVSPRAASLEVNPNFPKNWSWMAVSKMPYHGMPLTILAISQEHMLYTTFPIQSSWKQMSVPEGLQERFKLVSDKPAFWLVVPTARGNELIAASDSEAHAKLVDLKSGRVVADFSVPAGGVVREDLR